MAPVGISPAIKGFASPLLGGAFITEPSLKRLVKSAILFTRLLLPAIYYFTITLKHLE